jgi:hypothetical protein
LFLNLSSPQGRFRSSRRNGKKEKKKERRRSLDTRRNGDAFPSMIEKEKKKKKKERDRR